MRAYQQRRDYSNMHSISNNLGAMARDFEDAQDKSDRLNKKGYKASAQKVDAAASRLESASQQWESQAPFIFETLQALDESRVNQLRDLLTQYQTHEADQAQRAQDNAVEALAVMLEISTEKEIQDFAQRMTLGRPPIATRTSTRRSSMATGPPPGSSAGPPSLPAGGTNNTTSSGPPTSGPPTTANSQAPADDDASEHNSVPPPEVKPGKPLCRPAGDNCPVLNVSQNPSCGALEPCLEAAGGRASTLASASCLLKRAGLPLDVWAAAMVAVCLRGLRHPTSTKTRPGWPRSLRRQISPRKM